MKGLKSFLQYFALIMAVFLIATWMGAQFSPQVWTVILIGLGVSNLVGNYKGWHNGVDFGVDFIVKQLPKCDDPNCSACNAQRERENAKGN